MRAAGPARSAPGATLDARTRPPRQPARLADIRTAALLVQILVLYFVAGAMKCNRDWLGDGTAVRDILHGFDYVRPTGAILGDYSSLCTLASRCTPILEILGPLLLICPVATARVRVVVLSAFFLMHIGFEFFLDLGLWPLRSMVSLIPLVPSVVWDAFWPETCPDHAAVSTRDSACDPLCPAVVVVLKGVMATENVSTVLGALLIG